MPYHTTHPQLALLTQYHTISLSRSVLRALSVIGGSKLHPRREGHRRVVFDIWLVELVHLLHPDARLEGREQVSHQLAEVDAYGGVVVDGYLVSVELVFYVHYGHRQAVCVYGHVVKYNEKVEGK